MSADTASIMLAAPLAGWLAPLDEVPDPVFAERMMGDGFAIDPTAGELVAPADATVISIPDSAHAVTLQLANGAELLIHIGLETVALGGEGFTPLVRAGDRVTAGWPLLRFDLDRVARAATALITPVVVASPGYTLVVDRLGRPVAAGERVATLSGGGASTQAGAGSGGSHRASVRVTAPHGIHARPAARLVAALRPFAAQVALVSGDRRADARSTVALLGLGVGHGATVEVESQGDDARGAVEAVVALIERGFDEGPHAHPAPAPVRAGTGPVRAAPGLAVGQIRQLRAADRAVPRDGAGVAHEQAALDRARSEVAAALGTGGLSRDIAEAHRALLDDPQLASDARADIAEGRSAAHAWRAATASACTALRATGDALLVERVADLLDIERQLIDRLLGAEPVAPLRLDPGTILIAEDVLPSQFQALDHDRLAGICTAAGGPTAHVAILAASAGIPMLVAAGAGVLDIAEGTSAILDADAGVLSIDPTPDALEAATRRIAEQRERRATERAAAHAPGALADGTRIEVFANLGSVDDAARAVAQGAEGCGLLRTEFLFLDRATAPDIDEQAGIYRRIAATLGDRPLILRTLDIGGDKPVPYLPMAREDNPALGQRGIRLSLARPDLFETQLRAILAAVPTAQCRIMLPMIVDVDELRAGRALLDRLCAETGAAAVPLGVMIETPAAAMLADQLAREADFLSVGTNDLTQYALACDRGNPAVSAKVDALHPAVLRLIREVGRGAAAHGRWAGVCGGLAGDPDAAPILVGLGITELSAPPSAVSALKAALARWDMAGCRALAQTSCAAESPAAVRAAIEEARR